MRVVPNEEEREKNESGHFSHGQKQWVECCLLFTIRTDETQKKKTVTVRKKMMRNQKC